MWRRVAGVHGIDHTCCYCCCIKCVWGVYVFMWELVSVCLYVYMCVCVLFGYDFALYYSICTYMAPFPLLLHFLYIFIGPMVVNWGWAGVKIYNLGAVNIIKGRCIYSRSCCGAMLSGKNGKCCYFSLRGGKRKMRRSTVGFFLLTIWHGG